MQKKCIAQNSIIGPIPVGHFDPLSLLLPTVAEELMCYMVISLELLYLISLTVDQQIICYLAPLAMILSYRYNPVFVRNIWAKASYAHESDITEAQLNHLIKYSIVTSCSISFSQPYSLR